MNNPNNFDVKNIILFGSYAWGDPHEYSDIDIAIIAKDFKKDYFGTIRALAKYIRTVDARIEIKGFTPEEFVDEHPLAWEIKKHGITIK